MNTPIAAKTSTPVYCWDHYPYLFTVVNLQNTRNLPALFTLQMLFFSSLNNFVLLLYSDVATMMLKRKDIVVTNRPNLSSNKKVRLSTTKQFMLRYPATRLLVTTQKNTKK